MKQTKNLLRYLLFFVVIQWGLPPFKGGREDLDVLMDIEIS